MPPKARSLHRKKRIFQGNQHCVDAKPRKGRKKPKLSTPCDSEIELECHEDGPAHGTLSTSLSVQRPSATASHRKLGSNTSTLYPMSSMPSTSTSRVPAHTTSKGVRRKITHSPIPDFTSSESSDELESSNGSSERSNESSGSVDGHGVCDDSLETIDFEDGLEVPIGYRLIDVSHLGTAVSCLECPGCHTQNLILCEASCKYGLASIMVFQCMQCNHSTNMQTSRKIVRFYDINRRIVTGMHLIGRGLTDLETLCAVLNMPKPMTPNTYSNHAKALHVAAVDIAKQSMQRAAEELKSVVREHGVDVQTAIDIEVSCDGSWHRRGHSSLYGLVAVISAETGKVLDYTVKSRFCVSCMRHARLDPQSEEYQMWKQSHLVDGKCLFDFDGSANAIEAAGAVELWSRSMSLYNLQYTTLIGDGDSKAYSAVVDSKPYGDITITKSDCIGHVQKRLGTALRKLKKTWGKRRLKDGKTIGGRGRLTDKFIDKLQGYYGKSIRENGGSVDAMQKAVYAILYHRGSSDRKPMHKYCPKGADSWCGWQRDRKSYTHHGTIPPAIFEELKPIFTRLSDRELLERCVKGQTQNANESLHHVIWQRCPKERFAGRHTVETAVALAVASFNDGAKSVCALLQSMGLGERDHTLQALVRKDKLRLYHAAYKGTEFRKQERKRKRRAKKGRDETLKTREGDMYVAGRF